MQNREELAKRWLTGTLGHSLHEFVPLTNDASFRRYFRIVCDAGCYILMDAPPAKEDCTGFIDVTQRLMQAGVRVPAIHSQNIQCGFLLLDDLGDTLFLNCLNEKNADRLYRKAIDALLKIQTADFNGLPLFDETSLMDEMRLFPQWYCAKHLRIELGTRHRRIFETAFKKLAENAATQPAVFIHRDYHSRNLLLIEAEDTIGVLDYQDAVAGPITYDLVSLLKDCYIAWSPDKIDGWVSYFQERSPNYSTSNFTSETFKHRFNLMGAQRHFKASGIFARLYHRDNKAGYLKDIPHTLRYITDGLKHDPEFADVCELIRQLPSKK